MNALRTKSWEIEERKHGKRHDLGVRREDFKSKGNYPKCQKSHPGKPCEMKGQGCYTCGESDHLALDCPKGPICFNCQQAGHLSRDCPQRREVNQPRTNQGGQQPQQGRVFSLTGGDANANLTAM